jgi:uncharacterized damage-inducible protein DinB
MDPLATYRAHAAYNTWMNRRLYQQCARLSDDERRRDRGAFFGSIQRTLGHLVLADRVWLTRFTGDRETYASRDAGGAIIAITGLDQELYADFGELRRQRELTDGHLEAYVAALSPAALDAPFRYANMAGARQEHVLWWALSHVFNHQTHHRGQVTTMLFQTGIDPGVTDLIAYLRNPTL